MSSKKNRIHRYQHKEIWSIGVESTQEAILLRLEGPGVGLTAWSLGAANNVLCICSFINVACFCKEPLHWKHACIGCRYLGGNTLRHIKTKRAETPNYLRRRIGSVGFVDRTCWRHGDRGTVELKGGVSRRERRLERWCRGCGGTGSRNVLERLKTSMVHRPKLGWLCLRTKGWVEERMYERTGICWHGVTLGLVMTHDVGWGGHGCDKRPL